MFDEIKKCLSKYEEVNEKYYKDWNYQPTNEELDILDYFELYFAKAIMSDLKGYNGSNASDKVAKIISAMQGVSNEIKVKIE